MIDFAMWNFHSCSARIENELNIFPLKFAISNELNKMNEVYTVCGLLHHYRLCLL